jgi:hypothetical protein
VEARVRQTRKFTFEGGGVEGRARHYMDTRRAEPPARLNTARECLGI